MVWTARVAQYIEVRNPVKLTRALIPAVVVSALLLSGCVAGDGGPSKDAAGKACLPGGAASKSVEVSGKVGKDLKLKSKTPVTVKKAERTVLKVGKGEVPKSGETIEVTMTIFSGVNGKMLQQAPKSPLPVTKGSLIEWAYDAFRCATPDQQAAFVAPVSLITGGAEPDTRGLEGVTNKDSLVFVMQFGKVAKAAASDEPGTLDADKLLKRAEGKAKEAPNGFPTVKLDKDGAPTITMPKGVDAPKKLEVATLIQGTGDVVKPGDRVYVHYRGVIWRTGEEFDSSWSRGEPADFLTDRVIPGFTKALEGQKVGSQVISIVPTKDGYGEDTKSQLTQGKPDFDVKDDDTLVFVLDILGTVHAK